MACFTLTGEQRRLLADAIEVGMGEMDDGADYDLLASMVEEITASDAPIEITVMRIEDEAPNYEFTDLGENRGLSEDDVANGWSPRIMLTEDAPEADRDRWN